MSQHLNGYLLHISSSCYRYNKKNSKLMGIDFEDFRRVKSKLKPLVLVADGIMEYTGLQVSNEHYLYRMQT